MTTTIQSVIKSFSKVTSNFSKKLTINLGLILTTMGRKNTASMTRYNNMSYSEAYVRLGDSDELAQQCIDFIHSLIHNLATEENRGYLLIDFTMLQKAYAHKIENITYDYDGTINDTTKGLSTGVICWSNGKIIIPFNFSYWLRKKDAGDAYKKKTELAQELIKQTHLDGISFSEVILDGAFASKGMIDFLEKEGINYTMRIPKNRIIENETATTNLSKHPDLILYRNERSKTAFGSYKGHNAYFTVQKRKAKSGKISKVFIISSVNRTSKEHIKRYDERWPEEKVFRTSKQNLGLKDCQSIFFQKQRLHFYLVMTSHTILSLARIYQNAKSVEEVLNPIRFKKMTYRELESLLPEQTIMH